MVFDVRGAGLPGVTVVVKGLSNELSQTSTATTRLQIFRRMPSYSSNLLNETKEVTVGTNTSINITLEDETIGIEEVVGAIGYGTKRRKGM